MFSFNFYLMLAGEFSSLTILRPRGLRKNGIGYLKIFIMDVFLYNIYQMPKEKGLST